MQPTKLKTKIRTIDNTSYIMMVMFSGMTAALAVLSLL